ncbi:MAG TPA: sigma-70 family RNA polymerase sigma factor [Casimicrobiaceae bacterium]|nr:sigma-70 family RNA polymerase sigma factor [Casimicrobiaceae bacterium]
MFLVGPSEVQATARARRYASEADDLALIDRVAHGDRAAFDLLFRRYGPRLRRFLERTTQQRPHLIDEILNDTMLVIWRKAGSFDLRSKVSTWILGIALRRSLKARERAARVAFIDHADPTEPATEPDEHLSRRELRADLDRALESLSPEHRAVVELTHFEGYSYPEIAGILGCPVDTVKTRMFHARRRLRALLADRREDAA